MNNEKIKFGESEYQTLVKFYKNLGNKKMMVDNRPINLVRSALLEIYNIDYLNFFESWNEAIKRKDFVFVKDMITFLGTFKNWSEAQQEWMILAIKQNIKVDSRLAFLNSEQKEKDKNEHSH